jgi:hypothetical protein
MKEESLLMWRFLIVADKPAFIDTFPVLREELPVSTGFHRGMVLLPADEAFHQSSLPVYQLCGVFFPGHIRLVRHTGRKRY